MRAVFFVRVVGLVRPLEHGFAGTHTRAVSRVLLAGFATLGDWLRVSLRRLTRQKATLRRKSQNKQE